MTTATLAAKSATRRRVPLARQIRDWHSYLGALIAPSVLFFATTGCLQLWSLHEAHGAYDPPPLIERLGALHKDQKFALGHHHHDDPPPAAKASAKPAHDEDGSKPATLMLKGFFTLVGLSLIASTLVGLWIALTQSPRRRTLAAILLIGAVVPLVLAVLTA
ncbi:MAG: hypothetical protein JO111_08485 [Caulobacteraceae bacterium]|nr:hypothetical protein [Caulobacteraceae bacterium]